MRRAIACFLTIALSLTPETAVTQEKAPCVTTSSDAADWWGRTFVAALDQFYGTSWLAKHGQTMGAFPGSNLKTTLAPQLAGRLNEEANAALSVVRSIQKGVIAPTYGKKLAAPALTASVTADENADAQACTASGITLSADLMERLWLRSIEEAVKDPGLEVLTPPSSDEMVELLREQGTSLAGYERLKASSESPTPEGSVIGRRFHYFPFVRKADAEYTKALLFVLGHEASHHWQDGCDPENFDETRADLYGLLISATYFAEQFAPAFQAALKDSNRKKLIKQKLEEQRAARVRLRKNIYPQGFDDLDADYSKSSDEVLAKKTLKQIRDSVTEDELYEPSAREVFGQSGFETFTDIYLHGKLREYGSGDALHPPIEVRRKNLELALQRELDKADAILARRLAKDPTAFDRALKEFDRLRAKALVQLVSSAPPLKAEGPCTGSPGRMKLPQRRRRMSPHKSGPSY